mmetsp:Transcript_150837/g.482851  ORF Transcript_150837/g.482851 Transcript_150837/m.482851 type:complete len:481 (+) Transcript_150837:132-1574(+)
MAAVGFAAGSQHSEGRAQSRVLLEELVDLLPPAVGIAGSFGPVSEAPGSRQHMPSIGCGVAGAPSVECWSEPFRSICGRTSTSGGRRMARRYEFQVATFEPNAPSASSSAGAPRKCKSRRIPWTVLPMTLPPMRRPDGMPQMGPSSMRFPEMLNSGLQPFSARIQDEYLEGESLPSPQHGQADYLQQQPFKAGSQRPRLLERKEWLGVEQKTGSPSGKSESSAWMANSFTRRGGGTGGAGGGGGGGRGAGRASGVLAASASTDAGEPVAATAGATATTTTTSTKSAASAKARHKPKTAPRQQNAAFPVPFTPGGPSARDLVEEESDEEDGTIDNAKSHDDEESNRAGTLANFKHSSDKRERMKRLGARRKNGDSAAPDSHRDRLSKRQDLELAQESFSRYFPQRVGKTYDAHLAIEALADFGIKATTQPEKHALNDLLSVHEEKHFGFGDFCSLIEEARGRMRELHSFAVFKVQSPHLLV